MRICFLGDAKSIHIKRWVKYFRENGHEVQIITFNYEDIPGVEVYKIGNVGIKEQGNNWKYIFYIKQIKKILNEIKPDIVNAHYVTSYGFLAALTGYRPLVLSAWGSDVLVTPEKNLIYKYITKYAIDKSDIVISESQYLKNKIEEMSSSKTLLVPMGVENEFFEHQDSSLRDNDEIKILSLRTLTDNSNIDIIVIAFAKLVEIDKKRNYKLIIGNKGSEYDNIKKLIQDLKIDKYVDMKGFITRDEISKLYKSCNIHISIPKSDSNSVTVLEAMSSGIINIVSNIPSNCEWIIDSINGIILDEFNEDKLADCILKAVDGNYLFKDYGSINRELIKKKAIWENNMSYITNEYEKLINMYKNK